jgi:hypothetical protein
MRHAGVMRHAASARADGPQAKQQPALGKRSGALRDTRRALTEAHRGERRDSEHHRAASGASEAIVDQSAIGSAAYSSALSSCPGRRSY